MKYRLKIKRFNTEFDVGITKLTFLGVSNQVSGCGYDTYSEVVIQRNNKEFPDSKMDMLDGKSLDTRVGEYLRKHGFKKVGLEKVKRNRKSVVSTYEGEKI